MTKGNNGSQTRFNHTNEIREGIVRLLYSQARTGVVAAFIVAGGVLWVLKREAPLGILVYWYMGLFLISLFRLAVITHYKDRKLNASGTRYLFNVFILITALGGLWWSWADILFATYSMSSLAFVGCALAGISASCVPFFAASRLACAAYIIPVLLPFGMSLVAQPNFQKQLLGVFTLLFLGLLLLASSRAHRTIYYALKIKFENIDLIKHLSATKNDIEKMNGELKNEVAEREMAEKMLRESEKQYRLVTDALPVLIAFIDKDMVFRFNNKAYEGWFKKPLADIRDHSLVEIIGQASYDLFLEHIARISGKEQLTFETNLQFSPDDERNVSVTLIPHSIEGEFLGYFSLISDMTPRMNYLATHDALTDLPNRSLFTAHFAKSLKRAQRHYNQVALLYLDLDNFKNVNDTMGHDMGDALLIKVTERIRGCLRDIDMLARLGGDEFTIILENITTDEVIEVADKIRRQFQLPFRLQERDVFITTSIGIGMYPEDGRELNLLLKNADLALYRAKERGRNTFEFYTEELHKKVNRKLTIESNLRQAIERDEMHVFYQPIMNVKSQQICGLEALLRWNHPIYGMIPPSDFIPVAEESGLIIPIGDWLIRKACTQSLIWQKENLFQQKVRIAINISMRQFRENGFVDTIASILDEVSLSGECLTLELTESLIMLDVDYSQQVIKAIKDLGISISIDDFGTGYSSLNYLRKFPIDILKIDCSFIENVLVNPEDASIVRTIIAMAHGLRMIVVAEGIETIEQFEFLKNENCDEIQGFLISVPQNPQHIDARMFEAENIQKVFKTNELLV